MRRHDADVGLIRSTVVVLAIGFAWSSFALADEPAAPSSASEGTGSAAGKETGGSDAAPPMVEGEPGPPPTAGQVQERTVSLMQAVHFTDATGQDVIVGPGSFRVEAEGTNRIHLLPAGTSGAVVLDAVSFTHQETVERPVPVTIPDPEHPDVLHLALVSPGGMGVEAIGTYSGVQPRAVTDLTISSRGTIMAGVVNQAVTATAVPTAQITPVAPGTPAISVSVILIPNHGPSGTPVYVQACGYQTAELNKIGTLSIGNVQARQLPVLQWCYIETNFPNPQSIITIQGPPGPVQVRLDVPGGLNPAQTATFTIDPGPAFVLNPRWKIVFGGAGVQDRETGLVWERFAPSTFDHYKEYDADVICERKSTGARVGWRVPTASEFGMLFEVIQTQSNPEGRTGFPNGHPFIILKAHPSVWLSGTGTIWGSGYIGNVMSTSQTIHRATGALDNGTVIHIQLGNNTQESGTPLRAPIYKNPEFFVWCVRGPGGVPIQ